ncbi:MAG: HAMP domain-containing histidine kinase [Bacteriovoracaceae bacterium]|nr:HAMP domain-containing histidine kinase [Bacteriovoracaceae bacterium]
MKTSIEFIFALSLFVTLLMAGVSYFLYRRHKEKNYVHLTEFWGALAVNVLACGIFQDMMPQVVALSMVGWIWPLKGFRLFLEDISQTELFERWKLITLGAGGFITVALASYGFTFTQYTFPFALSVSIIGLSLVMESKKKMAKDLMSPLHMMAFGLTSLFFISRLAFPFWRVGPTTEGYALIVELVLILSLAACVFAVFLEMMKKRHDEEMEAMLKERNDKLFGQSKYAELGMMSAGIAHEINNPLAVIQARTTQLLRIYRNPEKQKELADGLQQILYTSERINRTIQGVREFVHQDERGPMTQIPIKLLVDDVLAFTGQRMKNHGVNLRFYGLENYSVIGNKIQLEQIILNLLNNSFDAIEFLPDKWIEVSVHQKEDKIQIYFKDSGHGIPPEIASRIMEPFFSTKDIGKGTGLGLALARGIAEKHGGSLQYLSGTTHTTFLLELPKSPAQEWDLPVLH